MKYHSHSLADTKDVARIFLDSIELGKGSCVVALEGDLGSGKTAFTQLAGEILGIKENMHSPTFVIEKIYAINWRGFKNLVHIDAYRIEKESELLHLGWDEVVSNPENVVFIEWPSNVPGLIPSNAKKIYMKFVDENIREIEYA